MSDIFPAAPTIPPLPTFEKATNDRVPNGFQRVDEEDGEEIERFQTNDLNTSPPQGFGNNPVDLLEDVKGLVRNLDTPEDDVQKIYNSIKLGYLTGRPKEEVYNNYDNYIQEYMGTIESPQRVGEYLNNNLKRGIMTVRLGHMGVRTMLNLQNPNRDEDALVEEFDRMREYAESMPPIQREDQRWFTRMTGDAINMIGTLGSIGISAGAFAAAGGLFGGPPGATLGKRVGAFVEAFNVTAGNIYVDTILSPHPETGEYMYEYLFKHEGNQRVNSETGEMEPIENLEEIKKRFLNRAAIVSTAGGSVSALLEMLQLNIALAGGKIAKRVIGETIDEVGKKALKTGALKNIYTRFLLGYGLNWSQEVATELAQETVEFWSSEMASRDIEKQLEVEGVPRESIDQYLAQMKEIWKSTSNAMLVMALPGSVVSTIQTQALNRQEERTSPDLRFNTDETTQTMPVRDIMSGPTSADDVRRANEQVRTAQTQTPIRAIEDSRGVVEVIPEDQARLASYEARGIKDVPVNIVPWQAELRENMTPEQLATLNDFKTIDGQIVVPKRSTLLNLIRQAPDRFRQEGDKLVMDDTIIQSEVDVALEQSDLKNTVNDLAQKLDKLAQDKVPVNLIESLEALIENVNRAEREGTLFDLRQALNDDALLSEENVTWLAENYQKESNNLDRAINEIEQIADEIVPRREQESIEFSDEAVSPLDIEKRSDYQNAQNEINKLERAKQTPKVEAKIAELQSQLDELQPFAEGENEAIARNATQIGVVVPDAVLNKYKDRDWAAKEIANREQLNKGRSIYQDAIGYENDVEGFQAYIMNSAYWFGREAEFEEFKSRLPQEPDLQYDFFKDVIERAYYKTERNMDEFIGAVSVPQGVMSWLLKLPNSVGLTRDMKFALANIVRGNEVSPALLDSIGSELIKNADYWQPKFYELASRSDPAISIEWQAQKNYEYIRTITPEPEIIEEGPKRKILKKDAKAKIKNDIEAQMRRVGIQVPAFTNKMLDGFFEIAKKIAAYNDMDLATWLDTAFVPEAFVMQDEVSPDPNAVFQVAPNTDTKAFKAWFKDSKVVDEDGDPVVMYHGTTHEFEAFDPTIANPENDFGKGIYLTNEPFDVAANYAGVGPDLTARIALRSEIIWNQMTDNPEEFGFDEDADAAGFEDIAKDMAEAELIGGDERTIEAYVSLQDPVILEPGTKQGDGTWFDFEQDYDEETEEYGEPTGKLVKLIEAVREEIENYDGGQAEEVVNNILEASLDWDGLTASEVEKIIRESTGTSSMYYLDELVNPGDLIRRVFERMGFDGIIDRTVNQKFGSQKRIGRPMEGMTPDTFHVIAFKPTQVKALENQGTFDPSDARMIYQEDGTILGSTVSGIDMRGGLRHQLVFSNLAKKDTLFHELIHVMRFWLKDEDAKALEDYYGDKFMDLMESLKNQEGMTEAQRELEEDFVDDFMIYASEGKSPSESLNDVFKLLKDIIRSIYDFFFTETGENAFKVQPEVRAIFDKVLKSEFEGENEVKDTTEAGLKKKTTKVDERLSAVKEALESARKEAKLQNENTKKAEKELAKAKESKRDAMWQKLVDERQTILENERERAQALRDKINRIKAENRAARRLKAEIRRVRELKQRLAQQIVKPASKYVNVRVRDKIENLQGLLDPGFTTKEGTEAWIAEFKRVAELYNDRDYESLVNDNGLRPAPLNLWTVKNLKKLKDYINGLKKDGRTYQETLEAQNRKYYRDTRDAYIAINAKVPPLPPVGTVEGDLARRKNVFQNQVFWTQRPPRIFRLLDDQTEGVLYNMFVTKTNEHIDTEIVATKERRIRGMDKLNELDITLRDLQRKTVFEDRTYTRDGMIHIWIGMMNNRSADAIKNGNKIPEEHIRLIEDDLTTQEKELGMWLMDEFGENYQRLADVYEIYMNAHMGKERAYFPMIRVETSWEQRDQEFWDQFAMREGYAIHTVDRGFTIDRTKQASYGQSGIKLGAFSVWSDQVEKHEHWIAMGLHVRDMNNVVRRWQFKDKFVSKWGLQGEKFLTNYIRDIANPSLYKAGDAANLTSRMLRKNLAIGYLALNAITWVKQIPSIALFLGRVGPYQLLSSAGKFLTNYNQWKDFVDHRDPQMWERVVTRYIEESRHKSERGLKRAKDTLGDITMEPIKRIDNVVTHIGWLAVYDANVKTKGEREAVRLAQMAVLETQPSARAKDLAQMYKSGELLNWLTMFTNQLNNIWGMATLDTAFEWKNKMTGRLIGKTVGIGVSMAVMAYLAGAWRGDDDDDLLLVARKMSAIIPLLGKGLDSGIAGWQAGSLEPFPVVDAFGGLVGETLDKDGTDDIMKKIYKVIAEAGVMAGFPVTGTKRIVNAIAEQDARELLGKAFVEE